MYDLKQGRIPKESCPKCDCKRYLIKDKELRIFFCMKKEIYTLRILLRTLFLRVHDQHLQPVLDVREADIRIVV